MSYAVLYRHLLAAFIPTYGATVDVYAPNATGGAMVQVGGSVPGVLVPYTEAGQLAPPPPTLSGGRASYIWIDGGTATIGLGCELRYSGGTFEVQGTADWKLGRVCTVSKVATPYTATFSGTAVIQLDFSVAAHGGYLPLI